MLTKAKLAIAAGLTGVVLAIVGVLYYLYSDEKKDNAALTKVNATQSVGLAVAKDTIKDQAKTADITDRVVGDAVKASKADQDSQKKIDDFVAEKIDVINRKYPQPTETASPASEAAAQAASDRERDEEISRIRITGLWQTYCDVVPTDPQCKTN